VIAINFLCFHSYRIKMPVQKSWHY